jgi:hypothetical protein
MRWVAIIAYLLLLVATVHAQNFGLPIGASPIVAPYPIGTSAGVPMGPYPITITNPGPPPVCSNSLVFTDQCNSQYLVVVVF